MGAFQLEGTRQKYSWNRLQDPIPIDFYSHSTHSLCLSLNPTSYIKTMMVMLTSSFGFFAVLFRAKKSFVSCGFVCLLLCDLDTAIVFNIA